MDSNLRQTKSVRSNIEKFEFLSQLDAASRSRSESRGSTKSNASPSPLKTPLPKSPITGSGNTKGLIQVIDDGDSTASSKAASPHGSPSLGLTPISIKTPGTQFSDSQRSPNNAFETSDDNKASPKPIIKAPDSDIVELRPVSSRASKPSPHAEAKSGTNGEHQHAKQFSGETGSPKDAVEILKGHPSFEQLSSVLSFVKDGMDGEHEFNVKIQGATSAVLQKELVATIIVDYWESINSTKTERVILFNALSSVPGLATLWNSLVNLIKDFKHRTQESKAIATSLKQGAKNVILISAEILSPAGSHGLLSNVITDVFRLYVRSGAREAIIQEFVNLVAGSKLNATISEAMTIMGLFSSKDDGTAWMGNSKEWSVWLGANIAYAARHIEVHEEEKGRVLGSLLKRGFGLGHPEIIVSELCTGLLFGSKALWPQMRAVHDGLRLGRDREAFLNILLRALTKRYLSTHAQELNFELEVHDREAVGGVAAIVAGLVENNHTYEDYLVNFLTSDGTIGSFETRRAMLAVLASKEEKLRIILERSLKAFGDKYIVQHGSMIRQEALAQVMLLVIGYLHRMKSDAIPEISHSSLFLNAVSNRLAASLPRARMLGMILGTCVSRLVDAEKNVMKFDDEDMKTKEAKWYQSLSDLKDEIGSIESLKKVTTSTGPNHNLPRTRADVKPMDKRRVATATDTATANPTKSSKVISIEEIEDSPSSDDDGLIPYEKPDEDPSDSDEDPTLINRSKPTAPVYISNLITQLRSDEPETLELALRTSPSLIRRKIGFGTEILENIDSLLSTLIGLQEKGGDLKEDDFHSLRLQSLIACFLALPDRVGLWLSTIFFEGDFSAAQRAVILTVIGLGARELAGFDDAQVAKHTPSLLDPNTSFPSKRLPNHLSAIYSSSPAATDFPSISSLADQISHSTIRPLALSAADSATGPNILKVRTFSSRLTKQQQKQPQKSGARKTTTTASPKTKTPHTLSTSLYNPLCTRLHLLLTYPNPQAYPHLSPPLLRLTLQTLTLLLSTLGPHNLHSQQSKSADLTRETLLLLITLHTLPPEISLDPAVLPATLQLFLTLMELNTAGGGDGKSAQTMAVAEERLVTEYGEWMAELVRWVGGLGDIVAEPPVQEEAKAGALLWTVLAAGIQVKWHEVGRKFQGRMLGLMGVENLE